MNPEEKKLLEETAELARDNHRLLKKMYNAMRVGRIVRIAYWVILIGASVGAFYFLQPYIDRLLTVYGNVQHSAESVNGFFSR
jgi:hypothetical protein